MGQAGQGVGGFRVAVLINLNILQKEGGEVGKSGGSGREAQTPKQLPSLRPDLPGNNSMNKWGCTAWGAKRETTQGSGETNLGPLFAPDRSGRYREDLRHDAL